MFRDGSGRLELNKTDWKSTEYFFNHCGHKILAIPFINKWRLLKVSFKMTPWVPTTYEKRRKLDVFG